MISVLCLIIGPARERGATCGAFIVTLASVTGLGQRGASAQIKAVDSIAITVVSMDRSLAPLGRPIPRDARSNDRWFKRVAFVVTDMSRAYSHLQKFKVESVSEGPQRLPDWNPAAGCIRDFCFKDPDRHMLEILQSAPDKGDPKWHRTRLPSRVWTEAASPKLRRSKRS